VRYLRRVVRLWSFARSHGFDLLIVAAAIGTALDVAYRHDALRAPRTTPWFTVPATVIVVLLLLGRHRWPFAVPLSVWGFGAAVSFVDGRLFTFTAGATAAGMASSFLLGEVPQSGRARLGLAIVLGGAVVIVVNDPNHAPSDVLFVPIPFACAWLAGMAVRQRGTRAEQAEDLARRAEHEREAVARVAVAEERARIARELHDIVAHAVSVMVLQVGAVRHNLPDALGEDKQALKGVEGAGRSALAEMRRLLGAMRSNGDSPDLAPTPGLDNLDRLLDEVQRAGLPVRLRVDGDPFPLPSTLDLSAYRVVQEGLTNALKHADASAADVLVRYGSDALRIEVRDDGRATSPGDGTGHGLLGVRERVKIYGGEMTAGAATGGGFVLSTRFPLDGTMR
jgi:signal transduction histidine kinase